MVDPLARVEWTTRAMREASAADAPRWLVLSRFGCDFLGPALQRQRPTEIEGIGLLRIARLRDVPLLTLDRDPGSAGGDALADALPILAARAAGIRGVVQCVGAAALDRELPVPSFTLVRDWLRWNDEDPLRGLPVAKLGARYPDLRGLQLAPERAVLDALHAESGIASGVAVQRRGPTGASLAELEAMRRLGGQLVVEAGAAESIAALQQGLHAATIALVLDAALAASPADPGALAAAADEMLPRLPSLVFEVVSRLSMIDDGNEVDEGGAGDSSGSDDAHLDEAGA